MSTSIWSGGNVQARLLSYLANDLLEHLPQELLIEVFFIA